MGRYDKALADWDYLWTAYGPASDMTGGYVDQGDLDKLLRSPTKATAAKCLGSQIEYWFEVGPEANGPQPDPTDRRLQQIAEDYGYGHLFPSDEEDE